MVQTMAARTWSVKPGPRGADGVLALYGYYAPSGGAPTLTFVANLVVIFECPCLRSGRNL